MVIGKIIPRKYGTGSFRDSVNYNLALSKKETDKVEYVNTLNIFAPEAAIAEMEALALENTRSADPVFNCILSWRENEIPTREQTDEAVEIVLKELGLEGCLTHYALHRNTENLHLHICVNRIDPETYKARDPAHGWTKKALEKAARKIELAQGWEIERTGRYVVTDDGEILEKPREYGKKAKLSQTARDIEAHTGEKSAERIGQETAAPIIREAKTWGELHQKLAEQGIKFERKGSGAILHIGETVIKASQAGRDISLSKLEKRLGEYREPGISVFPHVSRPEAIERVEAIPRVKRSWKDYQKAKVEYLAAKKKSFSELRKRQADERKSLVKNQHEERSSLFRVSWKGRGAELNQRRSVMAAKHQNEKLGLFDRHREERENLKKRFPHQFPGFKKWLSLNDDKELLALYRYPGQIVLFSAEINENYTPGKSFDLRDYSPAFGGKRGGVMYCKSGKSTADFIDYGKRIVVSDKFDEASILAALQLASQKWGSIQVSGSEEYKRLCVSLAVKHNFKIANPELRKEIDATRGSMGFSDRHERKSMGWSR
ncbi:MAG: relaxase/mobilization nuclease domain-containing protein [Synergistaceae bacterium]|nr:relaxase/mobilization nuclease domain-containing protein [Synergistaceae bacterium]